MEDLKIIWNVATGVRSFIVDMTGNNPEVLPDLSGACGIASYTLSRIMSRKGLNNNLVAGYYGDSDDFVSVLDVGGKRINHCWVETKYYIIDITAGQFVGNKNIEIKLRPNELYNPMLRGKKAELDFDKWPKYQQPKIHSKEIKKYIKKEKYNENARSSKTSCKPAI